ncbi:MAG: hypothetical protein AB8B50_03440 [Pirellulaceae bacterium]
MNRVLVVTCAECGKARELFDPRVVDDRRLGEATRVAIRRGDRLQLETGSIEVGCECDFESENEIETEKSESSGGDAAGQSSSGQSNYQVNLKHILLIVTTFAIVLGIFRRPIGMLFTENTQQWAMLPWSFFGWALFGTEVIDKSTLTKEPVAIAVFTVSVTFSFILPMVLFIFSKDAFLWAWRKAGSKSKQHHV